MSRLGSCNKLGLISCPQTRSREVWEHNRLILITSNLLLACDFRLLPTFQKPRMLANSSSPFSSTWFSSLVCREINLPLNQHKGIIGSFQPALWKETKNNWCVCGGEGNTDTIQSQPSIAQLETSYCLSPFPDIDCDSVTIDSETRQKTRQQTLKKTHKKPHTTGDQNNRRSSESRSVDPQRCRINTISLSLSECCFHILLFISHPMA